MKTLLLSKNDVQTILTMDRVIDSVKNGYLAFQQGKIQQPDIVSMEMPEYNGETDIKSCCNLLNKYVSVKIASGFYDNGKINDLPTMIGTIQILDATTGAVLCIMDWYPYSCSRGNFGRISGTKRLENSLCHR